MESNDSATRDRIVSFYVTQDDNEFPTENEVDRLFKGKHASGIDTEARQLIKALLQEDALKRPSMHQVAKYDFFTKADVDVFSLHRQAAFPLDVGDVSPAPDAQWSRRQFSSIWAPQPVAYNISLHQNKSTKAPEFGNTQNPIPEGEEASAFFSAVRHLPKRLDHILES